MKIPQIQTRYVLAFMGFWGAFCQYLLRQNISVAIIEMVDFTALENSNSSTENEEIYDNINSTTTATTHALPECPDRGAEADANQTRLEDETRFVWTGAQQGLILGSYSYGSVISLVAMTTLSRRLGHVRVLGVTILGSSVLNILTPVVTEAGGYAALVVVRICAGILTGHTASQLIGLAGIWSPPQERSKIVSFMLAGSAIGVSCVMPIAGLLAGSLGWKSVFYVTGGCATCWSILWLILIHETPEKHPRISSREKQYITSSLTHRDENSNKINVPWLKILKSGPFLCLVAVHFCSIYGRTTFTSMLPTYLKTILKFDVRMSGILSAVPFAVTGILMFVCGPLADLCLAKGIRSIVVRKCFTCVGSTIAGATVIALAFSGCNVLQTMLLVTVTNAMDSVVTPGFKACMIEISPEFSGIIFAMSATVANLSGILAPQITGVLRDEYGFLGWQIAFWIAGAIFLSGALEFFIFGTNERQNWKTHRTSQPPIVTVTEAL